MFRAVYGQIKTIPLLAERRQYSVEDAAENHRRAVESRYGGGGDYWGGDGG